MEPNKTPGSDGLPAEFYKGKKYLLPSSERLTIHTNLDSYQ